MEIIKEEKENSIASTKKVQTQKICTKSCWKEYRYIQFENVKLIKI